jgi:predicted transcriptional regulator
LPDPQLQQSIAQLPIPALWRKLGLPGEVSGNCRARCPWRPDEQVPAFQVHTHGTRFVDHETGASGSSFNLYCRLRRQDAAQARDAFITLADLPEQNHGAAEGQPGATDARSRAGRPKGNGGEKILAVLSEPGLEAGLPFERLLIAANLAESTFKRELRALLAAGLILKANDGCYRATGAVDPAGRKWVWT